MQNCGSALIVVKFAQPTATAASETTTTTTTATITTTTTRVAAAVGSVAVIDAGKLHRRGFN